MPKIVDHDSRRKTLAEAVVQIAAREGLAAATLRAVAQQSGMSMGNIQHYFTDREKMLDFVLAYVQEQRTERIASAVRDQQASTPQQVLNAIISEVLTEDEDNLLFERVRTMFLDRAMHHPSTANVLNEGTEQVTELLHGLIEQICKTGESVHVDARSAAEMLWVLLDALPTTVALGQRSMTEARTLTSALLQATVGEIAIDA